MGEELILYEINVNNLNTKAPLLTYSDTYDYGNTQHLISKY